MYQVIDIGNTYCKIADCTPHNIIKVETFTIEELRKKRFSDIFNSIYQASIHAVIISSVIQDLELHKKLEPLKNKVFWFNHSTVIPIKNSYKTPQTLGNDRLVAAIGASSIFPLSPILIIDAGTCITYDLLTADAEFIGGSISPGIQMRFNALHNFTDKLPLLNERSDVLLTGTTTRESILSGVLNGIVFEMQGIINAYQLKYSDLKIVITGGDNLYFENQLKNSIFAEPNLVLKGLLQILMNLKK